MNIRYILASLLSVLALNQTPQIVLADSSFPATANPILREHFRRPLLWTGSEMEVYLMPHFGRHPAAPRSLPGRLTERRVDALIEQFVEKLGGKLEALKQHFEEASRARMWAVDTGLHKAGGNRLALVQWKKSLQKVADKANDIRKMLSPVMIGLKSKSKYRPKLQNFRDSGFLHEMEFIGEEISKSEQRIRQLFVTCSPTVEVEDLMDGGVLLSLHRVRVMSKELSKNPVFAK